MKAKLKPCTFCGGIPSVRNMTGKKQWWWINCGSGKMGHGAHAVEVEAFNKRTAISVWNRRAGRKK